MTILRATGLVATAVTLLATPAAILAQQGLGGAQDISYSRQTINSGTVPNVPDFSLEGLFREQDIQPPAGQCDARVCLSLGYGFAPIAEDTSGALLVHVGVDSGIEPEGFKRGNLQLAVVVDKSGSMEGASMNSMKIALRSLMNRLTPEDELTLVEFNQRARLLLPPTRIADKTAILRAIEMLDADGGTNIEAGLTMGFKELAALPSRENTSKRLMLFTDAMPNIGGTDSGSFRSLTQRYAREGIGLTVFGVGVNFGHELVYHISQLRGGSSYFLDSPEKIAQVFEKEFDYLVTPLAYDLNVKIRTPPGLRLAQVYGLPTWKPGSADADLEIPTVFLSTNRSAILLRYEKANVGPLALAPNDLITTGSVQYLNPDGSLYSREMELRNTTGRTLTSDRPFYTHDGLRLAVALMDVYFGLRDGCRLYHEGKKAEALYAIERAKSLAANENTVLANTHVSEKIKLLEKLETNISPSSASGVAASAP